jgi:hypothetical protein
MIGASMIHILDKFFEIFIPPPPQDDMIYCPHCGGTGFDKLWMPCPYCGTTGYVPKTQEV